MLMPIIHIRAYAVGVFAGVTQRVDGAAGPRELLFRPPVAAKPPQVGGKRSSLEGFALQTSQLRNSYHYYLIIKNTSSILGVAYTGNRRARPLFLSAYHL